MSCLYFFMTSRLKIDCSNPSGQSMLLKFSQIVPKRWKQEVTKFGSHSLSGFRVAANTMVVGDKNPSLPPVGIRVKLSFHFNPILPWGWGKYASLLLFLHPKTAQGIKLKLSDFKDTPLRHILQVKPVRYILSSCHGNKITDGTSQDLASKKSEKPAICKDIELKFGTELSFGHRVEKLT